MSKELVDFKKTLRILLLDKFSVFCNPIQDQFNYNLYSHWQLIRPEHPELEDINLNQLQFDCVFLEVGVPNDTASKKISFLRQQINAPIIALVQNESDAIAVLQAGAHEYLTLEDWKNSRIVERSVRHLLNQYYYSCQFDINKKNDSLYPVSSHILENLKIQSNILFESEIYFRLIFEYFPIGIIYTDLQGDILRVNPKYCHDSGYSCEELIQLNCKDLIYEDDIAKNYQYRQRLIAGEIDQFCTEKRLCRKDKSIWWANVTVLAIRFPEQQLKGTLVLVSDISQLKRTEADLHESKVKFSRLIDNLPGVSYRYLEYPDGTGKFNYLSPRCQDIYERTAEEILQDRNLIWSLIHPEDEMVFRDMANISRTTLQPLFNEHRIITSVGLIKWIQLSAQPEQLDTGEVLWDGFIIDITDRKHAEFMHMQYFAESREWRQRYEIAGLASDQILFEFDLDQNQPTWGPNTQQILGLSKSEMPKNIEQWIARIHPEDQDLFIQKMKQNDIKRRTFCLEYRVKSKDDTYIWVEDKHQYFPDDRGVPKRLLGFIGDITSRKQVELELRKSESRFRKLSESISIGIFQTDLHGIINYANPYLQYIEGSSELNVYNQHWIQLLHPEDRGRVLGEFHQCIVENQPLLSEFRISGSQKETIWVLGQITGITLENGEIIGYIGSLTDITTNKKAEKLLQNLNEHLEQCVADQTTELRSVSHQLQMGNKLREYLEQERQHTTTVLNVTKSQLQAVLDAVPSCVMWVSSDLICLGVNPFMANFLQRLPEEFIGERVDSPESNLQSIATFIENFFAHDKASDTDECEIIIGQENKYFLFFGQKYSNNKLAVFAGIDITQHKIIEIEKTKVIEEKQNLIDLKSKFITVASHEFRTPLTTILTASELLEIYHDRWNEEKKVKYLRRIQKSVAYMTSLLEEVLVMNQSETKKSKLDLSKFCIVEVCKDIIEEVELGSRGSHPIIFDSHPDSYIVKMDEKILRHILINLLSNSIKYSSENSEIKLSIALEEQFVMLRVEDQGIGIPEENQKYVFDPFYRAQNAGTVPGTGLGLSIVKNMVELHGGNISLISTLDKGTQFTFSLPLN